MKALLLCGLMSAAVLATSAPNRNAVAPRQGAELLKTDLMGVFAHPDDETGMAATIAYYARGEGKVVAHVYCTRGEGGGNMVGTQWGAALGVLREAELRDCLVTLGVRHCYFLDQLDWAYTESVAATLRKWGREESLRRLVRHIRALRPEVIVTMNPAPTAGQHGHHQAAGVLATEAFEAAADPQRFREQIEKEGLAPWQVRKLYYGGSRGEMIAAISVTNVLSDGKTPAEIAGEALANHRSQGFGNFRNSPWLRRAQTFSLVKSIVPVVGEENSLFRGLPIDSANAKPVRFTAQRTNATSLELQFVPRPAVANYLRWVKDERIEHVAGQLAADLPAITGEANMVKLEVHNTSAQTAAGEIEFTASAGWRFDPPAIKYRVPPNQKEMLTVRVTPASGATNAELKATTLFAGVPVIATARVHPVPRLVVPRTKIAPAMDGTARGWELSPIPITPSHLVQGRATNEVDSSALFRLVHDGQTLFVDVEVKDDRVVTNIAPNDIRGHWRSDSVEICIDPEGGAEDTMACFKMGIFPFDTTGIARAARDADANQGLIEETAPGTRVASQRTPDGYRIRAAIPFREIGVNVAETRRLGFNIIIYDGDKADAAVGENINQSRLAWSPRSGVQGRPEDWGRIDLE